MPPPENDVGGEYKVTRIEGFGGKNVCKPDPWGGGAEGEFKTWLEGELAQDSPRHPEHEGGGRKP